MRFYFILAFIIIMTLTYSSTRGEVPVVNFSGYIDTYLAMDNDKISTANTQFPRQLTYLNPYKNQISLNIAQISAEMTYKSIRGSLALQAGDFVNTAFALNKTPMLQQANIGYNIFDKFWLDAGYFLTHIGGESVLPKDNWLSSQSMVTIFEPYFQSGIRAAYEGEKLIVHLHILNSNGLYEDNNENKTFGLYLCYKFSDDFFISYANVIGNEESGGIENAKIHILHNVVSQYNITKDIILKGQFDFATKEKVKFDSLKNEFSNGTFLGASLTAHYLFNDDFSTTVRAAYVNNEDAVYAPVLKGMTFTLGCEYKPTENSYIRIEGSFFNLSDDKYMIFTNNNGEPDKSKMELILNFGLLLKNN